MDVIPRDVRQMLLKRVNIIMRLKFFISIFCVFISCTYICSAASAAINSIRSNTDSYLSQPTGKYLVGFKDFDWINKSLCSTSLLDDKHKNDCHKVMVKIYYPTIDQSQERAFYNQIFMKAKQQEILDQTPNVPKKLVHQLTQIQSYSIENASIIKGEKFPVLIFNPGGGSSAALYENFITELVSHGYIVVGINTQFTGETKSDADVESKTIPFNEKVLTYVFEKIRSLHNSSSLFLAMDLNYIGVLGHSIGGRVLADVVHAHPGWFQAAATLDIGFDTTGASRKKFDIPFMHQIAANTLSGRQIPITFELGKNNFLVVISPTEKNHHYSHHINFTDLSTLQYLPAYQRNLSSLKQQTEEKFDLKFMSHSPTEQEISNFDKPTYILINKDNKWDIEYFKIKTDKMHPKRGPYHFIGGTSSFKGLDIILAELSNKKIESVSSANIKPIKEILMTFQRNALSEPFGTGNGLEITSAINTYLLQFFNTYLKDQKNPAFNDCTAISKNTYIKCGVNKI